MRAFSLNQMTKPQIELVLMVIIAVEFAMEIEDKEDELANKDNSSIIIVRLSSIIVKN